LSKVKKTLGMAIVFCIVFSFTLIGCANKAEEQKAAGSPTASSEAPNSSAAGGEASATSSALPEVKLTWYFPSFNGEPKGEENTVFEEVNKILKEKINATVDFKMINTGEYEEKMKVMMAASEEFDLAFYSNWFNNFQVAASKGNLLPLDEMLGKNAPKLQGSMPDGFWNAVKLNGKVYAVPNQQFSARSSTLNVPQAFADKYGFDVHGVDRNAFKLEDLEPYLETFKNGEPDKYPIELRWKELSGYYGLELISGDDVPGAVYMKDDSLKVFNQFESEEFKSHLALVNKWIEKGYFKSMELLSKKDQNLKPGEVFGAWFSGAWQPGGEALASQTYGVPMLNTAVSTPVLNNSGILATLTAISRTSKNPERAMMVLELMNSDEQLINLLTFGIEGKDYTKTTGNFIEQNPDSKYIGIPNWEMASIFNSYLIDGQPADVWTQHKQINAEAKTSPAIGFTFDPTPVKTEVSNTSAVIKEYVEGLTYGVLKVDKDYPVFVEKLKKAGSDKVIEEMQKQIDTWQASK